LRGRKHRAEKEKRRAERVTEPEVADDSVAEPGPPHAPDPSLPTEGIVSIAPAAQAAGEQPASAEAGAEEAAEEVVEAEAEEAAGESTKAAGGSTTAARGVGEVADEVVPRVKASPRPKPAPVDKGSEIDVGLAQLGETLVDRGAYVPRPTPRVIAVANQKGGVGKTTTAVNLGAALAELGYRVLIVDLDPQANATTGVGIDARSFELSIYDVLMRDAKIEDAVEATSLKNLFIIPATIDLAGAEIELVPSFSRELKLRRALERIAGDFDYTLVDCPPSLGLIAVNGLAAADEVLVPIQCEYYALEGLGQLLRNVQLVKSNLNEKLDLTTIVLTMYDGRTKLAEQVAEEVRSHFGSMVCRNVIPRTVRISEAPSFGQPITAFDSGSRGAIAYRELAKEVSGGAS
jgi:chromosome partitioning protein